MAKALSSDSDDLLTLLAQEPLDSRSSRDDDDDDSPDDSDEDDSPDDSDEDDSSDDSDDEEDDEDDSSDDNDSDDDDSSEDSSPSSSGSAQDDEDDDKDDDDSSSESGRDDDDDFVLIDGVLVKLRGDGSIDDSQPSGLTQTSGGFKLRGDGTVDDSQPGDLRVVGTRRDDTIIGPGVTRETLLGLKGSDDFVLGNRRDPFYEDSGKDRSYAILKDFSGKDEVVLHGSRSDYQISTTKESGVKGTGIFYKSDDGKDLVALIAGKGNLGNGALDFL